MPSLCKKLLVAVDFSPESRLAAAHAARLAGHVGGEIILVHAVPAIPRDLEDITGKDYVAGLLQDAEKAAFAQLEEVAQKAGCPKERTRYLVRSGKIAATLEEIIADEKPSLVCMGAHGTGETVGLRLGTIAEHVLNHAPCSVLLIRVPHGARFEKILVAVDFDSVAESLFSYARAIAKAEGAQLRVAHVFEYPAVGATVPGGLAEFEQKYKDVVKKRLQEYLASAGAEDLLETALLCEGRHVPEALVEQIARTGTTLAVVGTRERGRVAEFFVGSIGKEVARLAPVSILAVRPVPGE